MPSSISSPLWTRVVHSYMFQQDYRHWSVVGPLPSYGGGLEGLMQNLVTSDSSKHSCIENCNISMGYGAIALKSGWDEFGIAYGKPTTKVHIREVLQTSSPGSGIAFAADSERKGWLYKKHTNIRCFHGKFKRRNTSYRSYDSHPDKNFDLDALPVVSEISFKDIVGVNVTTVGCFSGIDESIRFYMSVKCFIFIHFH